MSIIKDVFFGGAEKKAAQAQQKSLEQAQTFTKEGVQQARSDVMNLFPQADQNVRQGFQGALDVFSQSLPQQASAFTGGNVAAQQALLAGLPQMQAAILGGQLQPLNIQPFQQQVDFGFANQTIPAPQQMAPAQQTALGQQTAPAQQLPPINNLLGGLTPPQQNFSGGGFGNRRFF